MTIQPPDHAAFVEAASMVRSWRRPLLVTHAKPDGDALGSLAAMQRLLTHQGIEAVALIFEPLPARLSVFNRLGSFAVMGRAPLNADGVIMLDTCALSQLEPVAPWLREAKLPTLAVDHHITRDAPADTYLIDESAAANCLILLEWAKAAGWTIDEKTASALFIGLASDTGWFRHSNTNARALAAASELTARGAQPNDLFQELYQRDSPGRVLLLGAALHSLEFLADHRVALMSLPASSFVRYAATPADTEDIVNEPLRVESVIVSVLFIEQSDGVIRVNFRSKAPMAPGSPDVDVAAIAQAFGGGGHRRAAGARIPGLLDRARATIRERLIAALP